MFEDGPRRRREPFEPAGAPSLPADPEGGDPLPLAGNGYRWYLLIVGGGLMGLGLLALGLGVFAQRDALRPLAALLFGFSLGLLLLAVLALLAWRHRRHEQSAG